MHVFRPNSTALVADQVLDRALGCAVGAPLRTRDLEHIDRHFSALAVDYGHTPAGAQWSDAETQRTRFARLVEIADVAAATILDLGCGTGALLDYLVEECHFRGRYVGYDLSEPALAVARARRPTARFERVDVLSARLQETFDYVLMSGVFNIRVSDNWELFTSVLTAIWPYVDRGLAFNLLSLYVDWMEDDLWYADPAVVFAFCKERLSPAVTLRHDYETRPGTVPYEFTVYVSKSRHAPRLRACQ